MALKKTLAQRLFSIYRITNPSLASCRITSSTTAALNKALGPRSPDKIAPDPGDDGTFRRFFHRLPMGISPGLRSLPTGEGLIEKLRGMDIARDRIRLDGLRPPQPQQQEEEEQGKITVEDARKLLRLSQLETVKARLTQIEKNCISQEEFLEICEDGCWGSEQAKQFAKMLDESGTVIVLGNVVFLRPQQVVKAIQGLMPASVSVPEPHPTDPRLKEELEAMEEQKAAIDQKADLMVRRELWLGLAYMVLQTAAFMRLTFWELSWDVMEPICFYVTSIYCMAGYAFFLRTSKEPSFEGFFQSRFSSKQKRLMKLNNFDLEKYNELRKGFCPRSSQPAAPPNPISLTSWTNNDAEKMRVPT
ncbi:calcium uniporter protein 2, mitochondrial-like [Coffea arabica]|uniref:Calcium uniporter protein 2, mitochondrial-like n=1 Tax=Coffea arabica TaxID=13443 RepID=A0A6P6TI91_COFAR|nr:calcium uniporter protein 2, mitochondrial-like [Coffea arabica]